MSMPTLLILLSVALSSLAHLSFKVGVNSIEAGAGAGIGRGYGLALAANPYVWLGIILHVAALAAWLFGLRKLDLSYAYPFISLGFVLVLLVSATVLDERLNAARILGVALIVAGVFFVARS
ncbi:MAG: EamA family transporter [Dongiaceae bacterium]